MGDHQHTLLCISENLTEYEPFLFLLSETLSFNLNKAHHPKLHT